MKNLLFLMLAAVAPALFAAPLPPKADLLAENTVVAQYVAVREMPCHFRTALCPDRCGHAKKVALFLIKQNENYAKHGQYGDEKAEAGQLLMIDMKEEPAGQPAEVTKTLQGLKVGDVVRLTQKHYYADFGMVVEPVRPITAAEKIGEEPVEAPAPKHPDEGIMPLDMPCAR